MKSMKCTIVNNHHLHLTLISVLKVVRGDVKSMCLNHSRVSNRYKKILVLRR